jgi:hypothetical protein
VIDLSDKTVMFADAGLFASFAAKLAPSFGKFYYYTPFQTAYPQRIDTAIGEGFKGMERVKYLLEKMDEIDLWIFAYSFFPDVQEMLRKAGHRVWGAGWGETLETDRWATREFLKRLKMPVTPAKKIIGTADLRAYLKEHDDKFVKASFYRGDVESFKHSKYWLSENTLDEIEHHLGSPLKQDFEFIAEDEIPDAVEIGYDGPCIDGRFPSRFLQGYEIKECGMIATVVTPETQADPVEYVNSKLSPALEAFGYRGFWSTEIRHTAKGESFLIDVTARCGTPSIELLSEMLSDWPEFLWYGAEGIIIPQKGIAKFGICAMVKVNETSDQWQPLEIPKEITQWVKVRNAYRRKGFDYAIPIDKPSVIAGVVGIGDTILEAVAACKEHADQLIGYQTEIRTESIAKGLDVIREGEKYGVHFTDQKLPTREEISKILDK